MLIISVISVSYESEKSAFLRRFLHCSTLIATGAFSRTCNYEGLYYKYLKTGDSTYLAPVFEDINISSTDDIEKIFESAREYTTLEYDLVNPENEYSSSGYITGNGYKLLSLFHNININSRSPLYTGAKNSPIDWHRYSTEIVGKPGFSTFGKTREDYARFHRNHCRRFTALLRHPESQGSNDSTNAIEIDFEIDELFRFPLPIL